MTFSKNVLLLFVFVLCGINRSWAQCDSATSIGMPLIVAASCPGNGQITVSSVLPTLSAPQYYQYSLFDTFGTVVKPYQDSNYFSTVNAGVYNIRVRRVCSLGVSPEISRRITVGNTYVPVSITSVTILHQALCNDGRISITATGGAPLQYALVTSLTVPDVPASYVRPKRSSNIFDSLAGGTYYVRVFDPCNGFATRQVVVPSRSNPVITNPLVYRYACDSFSFRFSVNSHYQVAGTKDTIARAWARYPDGTTDTIRLGNTTVTSTGSATAILPFVRTSRFDPSYNPALNFPDDIVNWPVKIVYGYRDACGNIYTDSVSYNKPASLNFQVNIDEADSRSSCDSVAVYMRLAHNGTAPLFSWTYFSASPDVQYSIDSGGTWKRVRNSGYSNTSDYFLMPRGDTRVYRLAICGDTFSLVRSTPAIVPTLNAALYTDNREACPGNSGISIRTNNRNGPLTVDMLSAPAGQPLIPAFTIAGTTDIWVEPVPQFRNLLPGTYQFMLTDSTAVPCKRSIPRTLTITPIDTLNFTISSQCSGDWLVSSSFRHTSRNSLAPVGTRFKVKVFNSSGVQVLGGAAGYTGVQVSTSPPLTTVTIPAASIATLPVGNYTILGYRLNVDTCSHQRRIYNKPLSLVSLDKSRFLSGCSSGSGTIVGNAESPFPPYVYTLYRGAISPDSILVPAGSTNIFNSLSLGPTYYLQVLDSCGNSITREMSVSETSIPISVGSGFMPCPGDSFTASVYEMPGATYQWYKDGVAIASATGNTLDIVSFSASDSGRYQVEVTVGSCVVFSRWLTLNPADCGIPLPLGLLTFEAQKHPKDVSLQWTVSGTHTIDRFVIQRSADGVAWTDLEQRKATDKTDYSYTDRNPNKGMNLYRLQLWTREGKSDFSVTKMINLTAAKSSLLSVYPNPASTVMKIAMYGNGSGAAFRISDLTGRDVLQGNLADNTTNTVNVGRLKSGAYWLKVELNEEVFVQQINIIE